MEAAIRLGPTTRAKNSLAELERRANQLLNGGNQLSATYKGASDKFFPEIYSAETEVKGVLRKCTEEGIKRFTQVVMDESVTPFSSTPELKVLGTEIAQMSYQHKVNVNLICSQMSGEALYSRVRPILAQACASKAQLAMTQFLAKESVHSYKACVVVTCVWRDSSVAIARRHSGIRTCFSGGERAEVSSRLFDGVVRGLIQEVSVWQGRQVIYVQAFIL